MIINYNSFLGKAIKTEQDKQEINKNTQVNKCIICGRNSIHEDEKFVKVCNKCVSEYKF